MAPVCADPRQIVIALNRARRRAVLQLVVEIISNMIQQLESSADDLGPVLTEAESDSGGGDNEEEDGVIDKSSPEKRESEIASQIIPDGQSASTQNTEATAKAKRIQKAAVKHMMEWNNEMLPKLDEIVQVEDSSKIQTERQKRAEAMEDQKTEPPKESGDLVNIGDDQDDEAEDIAALQKLYHPIPTRLTTIAMQDRKEALSCILLLLLSTGKYSAYSRTLALYLASSFEISQAFLNKEETEIAQSLMQSSTADKNQKDAMSAEAEAAKRRESNKLSRYWKVGLASVAGAAVIGVTGGLAAPLVAGAMGGILGGVGLGGVASFLGIFWMNGALVGALFGAYGGRMTGKMMDTYSKEIEDFRFIPLQGEQPDEGQQSNEDQQSKEDSEASDRDKESRRLRVTVGINGWLNDEQDITRPWQVLGDDTEVFALRYEMKTLLSLGTAFQDLIGSAAWNAVRATIIQRTVLAALSAALWPITVISAASNFDNPFSRASNRSRKAGQLLADALINRVQGERPVTLVGYSLGAAAIHACLQSLAERRAFGLVDAVVVIGAPAPSTPSHWRTLRTVVSGKIFNVYSENDMVLGYVYRMHSLGLGVAGLQAIQGVEGIENLNLSEKVSGHLRYPSLIGEILRQCGFIGIKAGTEIEKDEVIKLKDEHVGTGDASSEGTKAPTGNPEQLTTADELQGENPKLPSRPQTGPDKHSSIHRKPVGSDNPELPPRPAAEQDQGPALPRRPTEPTLSDQDFPLPRRGVASDTSLHRQDFPKRRPLTSSSDDSDHKGHGGISMLDNDDDED